VVEAFTYYAHREKLRIIGKEHLLEEINRQALTLAKDVAEETGTMLAGNVCNTNIWTGEEARDTVRGMFEEQVGWAVDAGVDFIIGETFSWTGEALTATEVIKATGLPAVITLTPHSDPDTRDGLTVVDACKAVEAAGADVVGLNCARGPATMLPLLEEVRAAVAIHVAALPVPYRTHATEPTMQSLRDPLADGPDHRAFPTGLDPFTCTRGEIARFTAEALALGIHYLGVCCGAAPHHVRAMAEALGRSPEASHYSADMSKHAYLGTDPSLKPEYQAYVQRL
jgi:betaine-homocysteine S-methyltransferase